MTKYSVEELAKLHREGHEQLNQEQWEKAAATFRKLVEVEADTSLRNNLAYALHMDGLHQDALDILAPNLTNDIISPYSRALASMILKTQGRNEEAASFLQDAIKQFDTGVRDPKAVGIEPKAWREYTVIIKRAAGLLGEHRLVTDLHRRWERFYQTPEDLFQVGVAFFNLNYPTRAEKVWSRIARGGWGFVEDYMLIARLVDGGLVPSFVLPYNPPDLLNNDEEWSIGNIREELLHGGNRALILAQLFDPNSSAEDANIFVRTLVSIPDDWGIAFGESILESNSLPMIWKMAAGFALTSLGVLQEGEPISMIVDGVSRSVVLREQELAPASPEQMERLEGIQDLLYQERYEEALVLLESDRDEGSLSLEGVELLAKLYATLGERESAEAIVDMFLQLAEDQDSDVPYIVVTDIYLRLGDLDTAWEYFNAISLAELPKGLKGRYNDLKGQLEM